MNSPSSQKSDNMIFSRAIKVSELSTHDRAVYETGKKILNDRLDSGKEFCKLMVIVSMSAVPIYLYLLVFALPHDSNLGVIRGIILLLPAVTFLLSAIIFSLGFLLGKTYFTLDSIDAIENMRARIVRHRDRLIILAFLLFLIGSLAAMALIVKAHL